MTTSPWIYILVMAAVTYLVRMLPLTLIRRRIQSPFIRSFLYYVPYAALAAMIFPSVFTPTGNAVSSTAGCVTAIIAAYRKKSLTVVAAIACVTAFAAEMLLRVAS